MKKISYENNEYYHIYNRGVDKRKIFLNRTDYKRFLFILDSFNAIEPVQHTDRQIVRDRISDTEDFDNLTKVEKLVEIDEYCLIPNHFHLLLRQLKDGGISKFLQKVMIGYTMYFNTKYERTGVLFQGRHKSKHVDNEPYLDWLRMYIHLNPLDLYLQNWKEKGIPKSKESDSMDFLNQYKWVSCDDYDKYGENLYEWEPRPDWQGI